MKRNKRLQKSLLNKDKTISFWKGYILDWVIDIIIAGMIVYIITTFAFQNMYVVGGSMFPTLQNGEAVLVNKLTYLVEEPRRNDIVAFKHVDRSNNEINFVKRIVGIPGDKIEVINDIIHVNGEPFWQAADDKHEESKRLKGNMSYPIIVPEGAYFVLGDNIGNSIDSRYQQVGIIPQNELIGKIFIRLWPFWKLKVF